jgi:hypothetical protein
VFDYYTDPALVRTGRFDMLTLKAYRDIRRIALAGARYAARLQGEGAFDRFDTDAVVRRAR